MKRWIGAEEIYNDWADRIGGFRREGNCSRHGKDAFSYAALIGRIEEDTYFVNTHKYSVTTSKHQRYLLRAIPDGANVVCLDFEKEGIR